MNGFMQKAHLTTHVRFNQYLHMPQGNATTCELSNILVSK